MCVNVFQIFNFLNFQFAGQLCQCLNISIFCVHFFNLFSLFLLQLFLRWHCAGFTFFGTHFPFSCHLTCSRLPCSGSPLVCNGDPHATKRFRNETNAIYCSFSLQPAVNWSTIGHLWLFCATVGGAPSHCQASRIQKYKINDTAAKCKTKKTKEEKILSRLLLADLFTFELSACQSLSYTFTHCWFSVCICNPTK